MTILVTGGLGYIGSHTVVELLNNDFEVVIIDDLSNTEKFILKNIEEITGKRPSFYPFDLRRKELLTQVFEAHQIDGCIHFAAYKAVGESQEKAIGILRKQFGYPDECFTGVQNSGSDQFYFQFILYRLWTSRSSTDR